MAAVLATLALAPAARATEPPEPCDYDPGSKAPLNPAWDGADVLLGKAATPAAILARKGRPLIVVDADLQGADFSGRELAKVCFQGGDLTDSRWLRATLRQVVFEGPDLRRADFDFATADQVAILGSDVSGMRGRRSRWRDLLLHNVVQGGDRRAGEKDFDGRIDFSRAELTRAEWRCEQEGGRCNQQFNFDLSGGRLDGFVYGSTWRRLKLDDATVTSARIEVSNLSIYAEAKVVGEVQVVAPGASVRLTPSEWRQLRQGLSDRWPGPLALRECRKTTRPALQLMCSKRGRYANSAKSAEPYNEMMQAYELAREAGSATPAEQDAALIGEADCLTVRDTADACLEALYRSRLQELRRHAPKSRRFGVGDTILFADTGVGFSPEFRRTATYAKLVPVLYDTSSERLYLTGLDANRIAVVGMAHTGNDHFCDVDDKLTLRANGWYGERDDDKKWMDVLRVQGDRLEVSEAYDRSVSGGCGGVAFWSVLGRLPVSAEILAKKAEPR